MIKKSDAQGVRTDFVFFGTPIQFLSSLLIKHTLRGKVVTERALVKEVEFKLESSVTFRLGYLQILKSV